MKKIKFNQPKYVFPLFALPLIFILFYILGTDEKEDENRAVVVEDELQSNLSDPDSQVSGGSLSDKVSEYKRLFLEGTDETAIEGLLDEGQGIEEDSIYEGENPFPPPANNIPSGYQPRPSYPVEEESGDKNHEALLDLIERSEQESHDISEEEEEDPVEVMREQFALLDSFNRTQDPEYKAQQKLEEQQRLQDEKRKEWTDNKMTVKKAKKTSSAFNTLKKEKEEGFIKAIIDESLTVHAGSRVRIKLQEDIQVGDYRIGKGTYLYAIVSGFSAQRIHFAIQSIMSGGQLLPVNLKIYDGDGLKGLYVPASAFREFTQELGSNTVQGFNMNTNSPENNAQFLMSSVQQAFTSTSQAISKAIRKNKANLKYSTFIYLIEKKN